MEILHLDNIKDSTTGTMHLLSFINDLSVFPNDTQIKELIEEICAACNAKQIISTKYALAKHRTIRYDRIWLLIENSQDATFLHLRYGFILDLTVPLTKFMRFYELNKAITRGTNESTLLSITKNFRYQKKEKLGVI